MGKLLDNFLSRNKKDINTIGKSLSRNLLIVEEAIIKRQQAIADAQKSIKDNAINNVSSADEVKRLKERLADTESKLLKVMNRDADMEILRHQLSKLESELEASHKRVESLEAQHEEDLRKLNKPVVESKKKSFYDA